MKHINITSPQQKAGANTSIILGHFSKMLDIKNSGIAFVKM